MDAVTSSTNNGDYSSLLHLKLFAPYFFKDVPAVVIILFLKAKEIKEL